MDRTALSSALCVLLSSGVWTAASSAETAGSTDEAAAGDQLPTITVTAERRSESLQTVPISVEAVTSSEIADLGVGDSLTLPELVPSLTYTVLGFGSVPFIRGVGTNNVAVNNESSVAAYVDGVYRPFGIGNLLDFNNVERVEVLEGPQGTLFGRNATGGVIQVVTRDPQQAPSLDANVGYANYNTGSASFYGTTGITQNLAADIAVVAQDQTEGWGRNVYTPEQTYFQKFIELRSKWLLTIDEATTARLTLDYSHMSGNDDNRQHPPGTFGVDGVVQNLPPFDVSQNPEERWYNGAGAALRLDHDFGAVDFVSITSLHNDLAYYRSDEDATPVNVVDGHVNLRYEDFTQEVQLNSPASSKIKWVLGAFYFNGWGVNNPLGIYGLAAAPAPYFDIWGTQRTESEAGYGQATVPLTSSLDFTGGVRYTTETQNFHGATVSPLAVLAPLSQNEQSSDKVTWRASLDYTFTPGVMAYISDNRGTKSGGFNLSNGVPFQPEQLDAYEFGVKSEFLDHRVRLNGSTFFYDYKDMQVYVVTTGTQNVENAAASRLEGAELNLELLPVKNLTIKAGVSLLHTWFVTYPGAQYVPADPGAAVYASAAGNETPFAPRFTASLSGTYVMPSSIGPFNLSADVYHNNGYYWTPDDRIRQPVYNVVNASLGWECPSGHFGVRGWVKNLGREVYYASEEEIAGLGDAVGFAAPRTFGINFDYKM